MSDGGKILHIKNYVVKLCSRVFDFAHGPAILRGNISGFSMSRFLVSSTGPVITDPSVASLLFLITWPK